MTRNTLVGVIALEDSDEPEISHLWVEPEYHGWQPPFAVGHEWGGLTVTAVVRRRTSAGRVP